MAHIWLILLLSSLVVLVSIVENDIRVGVEARGCNMILEVFILVPTASNSRLDHCLLHLRLSGQVVLTILLYCLF